jgi:O-methyltransferase
MRLYEWKDRLKPFLPTFLLYLYRMLGRPMDGVSTVKFLYHSYPGISFAQKRTFIDHLYRISNGIKCAHEQHEMLSVIHDVLLLDSRMQGCVVEAGCYKGGSTAKLSLAAQQAGRQLFVFDSFEGILAHDENHKENIFGESVSFPMGSYCGTLEEVQTNIQRFGASDVCHFIKGYFEESLPHFTKPIGVIYLDVDLASSTRTCLKYLYPLLTPGGTLYSQDGHLPLVLKALDDDEFWEGLGYRKPVIEGFGKKKLLKIVKPKDRIR